MTLENKSANLAKDIVVNALRFALALVFAFSGFVKAVDPMGTVYKLTEYADAFGLPTHPALLFLTAWGLIAVEYVMGVALFFGLYRRFYLSLMIGFLSLMTPLSLWLVVANPITDCGCFGDAIALSHGQTLGKNIALLVMAVVVLRHHKRIWRIISNRKQWLVFVYALLSIVLFMQYSLRHLPAWDFRPYAIGKNIIDGMTIPDDAPGDEYETLFVLEKDGVQRTFSFDDYPDSTWNFVSRESRLVSRGYVPPITDFALFTLTGVDVTWEVLERPGYTFLLVARDLKRTNEGMLDVINDLYDYAKVEDCAFYMLTSSNLATIDEWNRHTGAAYPYLNVDETLLKTMVRTNLGLIVLKDATVVGKWSGADLPSDEQQYTAMEHNGALSITPHEVTARRISVALWMFLPFLLLCLADRLWGDE